VVVDVNDPQVDVIIVVPEEVVHADIIVACEVEKDTPRHS
jgi:hypothetical protein